MFEKEMLDGYKQVNELLELEIKTKAVRIDELEARPTVEDDVFKAFEKGKNWDMYCRRQYKCDPKDEDNIIILQERLEGVESDLEAADSRITELEAENEKLKAKGAPDANSPTGEKE
tara:strand:+ start:170 stop:520 length:351 start_codon:yes stop_codon:yes gene_type:complete